MKYTDSFFTFPIRVYDRFTYIRAIKKEIEENESPEEGDWIVGKISIPYTEIKQWMDYFDSVSGVEGVKQNKGFTETLVILNDETFICPLNKKEFEALLDKHVQELDEHLKHFSE